MTASPSRTGSHIPENLYLLKYAVLFTDHPHSINKLYD
jgi:hypothetical protein